MMAPSALFEASRRRFRDCPALAYHGQRLTYGQVGSSVDQFAARLAADGLAPGQRIAIIGHNSPALVVALFAAWRVGAVAVPLSARYREYELRRILRDADVRAVTSVNRYLGYSFAEVMPQLLLELPAVHSCYITSDLGQIENEITRPACDPSASQDPGICMILYTSGTTGDPKGALIAGGSEVAGARALNAALGLTRGDVSVFIIPLTHAFGMQCFLGAMAAGSLALLVPSALTIEPALSASQRERATILHGSPAVFTSLAKEPAAIPTTLRGGFVAGAPCPAATLETLDGLGLRILNLYGMTELGAATCVRPLDPASVRYTTAGRALRGIEVRTTDAEGGEVEVRGPRVTTGYFRQVDTTAAAFDGEWFRTGDLGELDARGNLRISGRMKDLVKIAGFTVSPAEVEGLLLTHPGVRQAAVLGVPSEARGEALEAFVVPRHGAQLASADLLQFARSRIAGHKLPYRIHLLRELPLLPSGKPDRDALRTLLSRL